MIVPQVLKTMAQLPKTCSHALVPPFRGVGEKLEEGLAVVGATS